MKNKLFLYALKISLAVVILTFFGPNRVYSQNDQDLYDSQIKKYQRITEDSYFKNEHSPKAINEQFMANKKNYKQLRESNQKMLRLYDEEKFMNKKLRKMLSRQIEEEFRLRAEFKKIQKEFETNQASFMKNEMKQLGDKITDYEKIKDKSTQLTEKMTDNYAEYMAFQKEFKEEQEAFYAKQVKFYNRIESTFDQQMKKYEDLKFDSNDEIR